mmetsp:Transcript_78742/g.228594  ORF Transcript_78742/g.228594 Transcript_78742/m.228594 type:complete len:204 (-) Transcript_78742:774-1385(-)
MRPVLRVPLHAVYVGLKSRTGDALEHQRHLPGRRVHDGAEEHRHVRVPDLAHRPQLGQIVLEAPCSPSEAAQRHLYRDVQPGVRAGNYDAVLPTAKNMLRGKLDLLRVQQPMLLSPDIGQAIQGRADSRAADALLKEVARADTAPGGLSFAAMVLVCISRSRPQGIFLPALGELELYLGSQSTLGQHLVVQGSLLKFELSLPV